MNSNIEVSDQFAEWYDSLDEGEQDSVDRKIELLEREGPVLGRPDAESIHQSRYPNMKELRIQHQGRPLRILFVFDPRRIAYLILGGDKTGNDRWYEEHVPRADTLYERHLFEIAKLRD